MFFILALFFFTPIYNPMAKITYITHDNQKHIVNDLLQNGFELKEQHKRRNSDEHNYIFVKNVR